MPDYKEQIRQALMQGNYQDVARYLKASQVLPVEGSVPMHQATANPSIDALLSFAQGQYQPSDDSIMQKVARDASKATGLFTEGLGNFAANANAGMQQTPQDYLMAGAELAGLGVLKPVTKVDKWYDSFKGSRVADEAGEPITLYRGQTSQREAKPSKGTDAFLGEGIYATEAEGVAKAYAGEGKDAVINKYHANIKTPFEVDVDSGRIPYPLNRLVDEDLILKANVTDEMVKQVTKQLKDQGYDGVLAYHGLNPSTGRQRIYEAVVFDSNQLKQIK